MSNSEGWPHFFSATVILKDKCKKLQVNHNCSLIKYQEEKQKLCPLPNFDGVREALAINALRACLAVKMFKQGHLK